MKTTFSILAVTFLLVGDVSAQDFERQRPVRNAVDLMPRPVIHSNGDGTFRRFDNAAERDRVLAQESQARAVREENWRRYSEQARAQQERRSNEASWKLGAIGLGIFIGLLRILFGRR